MILNIKKMILEGNTYENVVLTVLEEAGRRAEIFNNTGNTMERVGGVANAVPGVGLAGIPIKMVGGYQTGSALGHPVVGTVLGRDAALGATSNYDKTVGVKDVYTKKNLFNKALTAAGAIGGMYAADELMTPDHQFMGDDTLGLVQKAGVGVGAGMAVAAPAVGYGLGKVFGRRSPK
jgi:hypothetical protein